MVHSFLYSNDLEEDLDTEVDREDLEVSVEKILLSLQLQTLLLSEVDTLELEVTVLLLLPPVLPEVELLLRISQTVALPHRITQEEELPLQECLAEVRHRSEEEEGELHLALEVVSILVEELLTLGQQIRGRRSFDQVPTTLSTLLLVHLSTLESVELLRTLTTLLHLLESPPLNQLGIQVLVLLTEEEVERLSEEQQVVVELETMEARHPIHVEVLPLEEVEPQHTEEGKLQRMVRRTVTWELLLLLPCLLLHQLRTVTDQVGKKMNGEQDLLALRLLPRTGRMITTRHLHLTEVLLHLSLPQLQQETQLQLRLLTLLDLLPPLQLKLPVRDSRIKLLEYTPEQLLPPPNLSSTTRGVKLNKLYRKIGSFQELGLSLRNQISKIIVSLVNMLSLRNLIREVVQCISNLMRKRLMVSLVQI